MFQMVRDPKLEPGPKALWLLVRSYETDRSGAFTHPDTLARDLGVSSRTVERWRAALVKARYTTVTHRGPKTAEYRAVLPSDAPTEASEQRRGDRPNAPTHMAEQGGAGLSVCTDAHGGARESSAKCSAKSTDTGVGQSTGSTGSIGSGSLRSPSPAAGEDGRVEDGDETTPDAKCPTAELLGAVQAWLWRGNEVPANAPHDWGAGAECKYLRQVWLNLDRDAERVKCRIRGLGRMARTGLLPGVGPDEGFTLGLMRALDPQLWEQAEQYEREASPTAMGVVAQLAAGVGDE